MRRVTEVPTLTPEDAAALIRTAFVSEGWRVRMRNTFKATEIVAALWVAREETGKERLGDLIWWARRLK